MISLLCPSRGRPANIDRLYGSLVETADEWELVVRLDNDDPAIGDYADLARVRYLVGARCLLSEAWNECWRAAAGPIFMHAGDDLIFRTPGWDRIVTDAFPADGIAFVHGSDGHETPIGTHGFLRREWTDTLGYFVPPLFASDYNDRWLTELADAIDRRVVVPILTEHMHPAHGKGEWDRTHRERIARHTADDCDAIWERTAPNREQDAALLRDAIG